MIKSHSIKVFAISDLQTESFYNNFYSILHSSDYDENKGFGFKDIRKTGEFFTGILLVRQPTNIPQLNIETGEFIDQTVFIYKEIDFLIHQKFSMIFVFGTNQDAIELSNTLVYKLDFKNSLSPIRFSPTSFVESFFNSGSVISVDRMTINNFQYREGIIGRYALRAESLDDIKKLLGAYKGEVSQIRFSINTTQFENINLSVSNSGSLIIRCDPDDIYDAMFTIMSKVINK